MKRAGILDTRVVLQRRSTSQSSTGEVIETWTTLATRWAAFDPLTGQEVMAAPEFVAKEQVQFTLRWDRTIADLSPLDRIICPASDATVSPEVTRSIYDIIAVHEPERNDTLRVVTFRRADVR